MSVLFLSAFLLGLLLTVLAMILGVQRGAVPSFPTPPEIERPTGTHRPHTLADGQLTVAFGIP